MICSPRTAKKPGNIPGFPLEADPALLEILIVPRPSMHVLSVSSPTMEDKVAQDVNPVNGANILCHLK
jgi:hypothetical protein